MLRAHLGPFRQDEQQFISCGPPGFELRSSVESTGLQDSFAGEFLARTETVPVECMCPMTSRYNLCDAFQNQLHQEAHRCGCRHCPVVALCHSSTQEGFVHPEHVCVARLQKPRCLPRHHAEPEVKPSACSQRIRCTMHCKTIQQENNLMGVPHILQGDPQPLQGTDKQRNINPAGLLSN